MWHVGAGGGKETREKRSGEKRTSSDHERKKAIDVVQERHEIRFGSLAYRQSRTQAKKK